MRILLLMVEAATAKGLVVGAYLLKKTSGSCVTGWSEKDVCSQQPLIELRVLILLGAIDCRAVWRRKY
jgi:hypothetical protein